MFTTIFVAICVIYALYKVARTTVGVIRFTFALMKAIGDVMLRLTCLCLAIATALVILRAWGIL